MKFYIALVFMCLCNCNNVVHCAEDNGLLNPIFNISSGNYVYYQEINSEDIDELTNELATRIGDGSLINRYSLNNEIGTLKFEGNENDTIQYYGNIMNHLIEKIKLVKQDYKNNSISMENAEIILNYFNRIRDNSVHEMVKILEQNKGFGNFRMFLDKVFSENMTLNYYNTIDN